jgi:hypothetical protein
MVVFPPHLRSSHGLRVDIIDIGVLLNWGWKQDGAETSTEVKFIKNFIKISHVIPTCYEGQPRTRVHDDVTLSFIRLRYAKNKVVNLNLFYSEVSYALIDSLRPILMPP